MVLICRNCIKTQKLDEFYDDIILNMKLYNERILFRFFLGTLFGRKIEGTAYHLCDAIYYFPEHKLMIFVMKNGLLQNKI